MKLQLGTHHLQEEIWYDNEIETLKPGKSSLKYSVKLSADLHSAGIFSSIIV